MNILHVAPPQMSIGTVDCIKGGLDRYVDETVKQQSKTHDVTVLRLTEEQLRELQTAIFRNDLQEAERLGVVLLKTTAHDVVHLHDWYGGVMIDALFAQNMRNIFVTSHLPLRCGFTYRDVDLNLSRRMILEQRCFDCAKSIISPSKFNAEFLESEYGIHPSRIEIVPNGVRTDIFFPEASIAAAGRKRLLIVGRLVDQKGVSLVIRAMTYLREKHPDAILNIIGEGDAKNNLVELVRSQGLDDIVRFQSWASPPELRLAYSNSDLLLIPSPFEPFGIVGLEALACSCPVLAFSPNGMDDYLKPSETIRSSSPRRIFEEIDRYLSDTRNPVDRKALRHRSLQWTWENSNAHLESAYGKI